jgi:hypothetical protein
LNSWDGLAKRYVVPCRNGLDALSVEAWRAKFVASAMGWRSEYSDVTVYPLAEWRR